MSKKGSSLRRSNSRKASRINLGRRSSINVAGDASHRPSIFARSGDDGMDDDDDDDESSDEEEDLPIEIEHVEEDDSSDFDDDEDALRARRKAEEAQLEEARLQAMLEMQGGGQPDISYAHDFPNSPEKWHMVYGFVKVFFFFLMVFGAGFIATNDYDKQPCILGTLGDRTLDQQMCLLQNSTYLCVGLEDEKCKEVCGSSVVGCIQRETDVGTGRAITQDVSGCIKDADLFVAECTDTKTCLDSDESSLLQAVTMLGLLSAGLLGSEAIIAVGLGQYAEYHSTDFERVSGRYAVALLTYTKSGPYISQLFWMFIILAEIYLLVSVHVLSSACSGGQTSAGTKYLLPEDIKTYSTSMMLVLIGSGLIGSFARHKWLLRGELFRPSNDDQIRVPCGLDCMKFRSRDSPRCCPSVWSGIESMCCCEAGKIIPRGCGSLVDLLCTPVIGSSKGIAWCWKHRHFIGP
eukprot:TRINITY_DN60106_c0_g1_i1.p1 TRINITY_DN60106_c0_g1~~TRINITY_DN60106_c0_g1_i1.p1  ORF type:complete len:526 (+),score=216.80 TRINITY_DN60106_c0_g1_i1:190-1578(+)